MPAKKKSSGTNEDNLDVTVYTPTETRVLTPEQAVKELVDREPASSVRQNVAPKPAKFPENLPKVTKTGYVVESVNPDEQQGAPVAATADESYQAVIKESSVDYTAVKKNEDDEEELKK